MVSFLHELIPHAFQVILLRIAVITNFTLEWFLSLGGKKSQLVKQVYLNLAFSMFGSVRPPANLTCYFGRSCSHKYHIGMVSFSHELIQHELSNHTLEVAVVTNTTFEWFLFFMNINYP